MYVCQSLTCMFERTKPHLIRVSPTDTHSIRDNANYRIDDISLSRTRSRVYICYQKCLYRYYTFIRSVSVSLYSRPHIIFIRCRLYIIHRVLSNMCSLFWRPDWRTGIVLDTYATERAIVRLECRVWCVCVCVWMREINLIHRCARLT